MVFRSHSDHSTFHQRVEAKRDETGVYYCEITSDICLICGNKKSKTSTLCLKCFNIQQAKNIPGKEELLENLIKHNMLEISKIYNVSDNAVRKWCKKYGLPYRRADIKEYKDNFVL